VRGGHARDARGRVEATRYPRNPLDVVAQQIVAMASMDDWDVGRLFATIRARRRSPS
jgi:ATP-dependent Lhr-like helicase